MRVVFAALLAGSVGWAAAPSVSVADGVHGFGTKVLHTFCGKLNCTDGALPVSDLVRDAEGNFYGTTYSGGSQSCAERSDCGVVFKLGRDGTYSVLYAFQGGADGGIPLAGLIMDVAGNLYGTTTEGGDLNCNAGTGCGTVFKMTPDGKETVLYSFTAGMDGAYPRAALLMDKNGNLYGTTLAGGSSQPCEDGIFVGCGTVFKLAPDGTETVLYAFNGGSDGEEPFAQLIMDGNGNLYGTTAYGGGGTACGFSFHCGTVFRIAPDRTETLLYAFSGGKDGAIPYAGLITDSSGNFYGTTWAGGAHKQGTVFKLAATGAEAVLHAFTGGGDGGSPTAALLLDAQGTLYGTSYGGGIACGVAFTLAPNGHEKVIHTFGDFAGCGPDANLITDANGNLYGTTETGADASSGAVFELKKRQ